MGKLWPPGKGSTQKPNTKHFLANFVIIILLLLFLSLLEHHLSHIVLVIMYFLGDTPLVVVSLLLVTVGLLVLRDVTYYVIASMCVALVAVLVAMRETEDLFTMDEDEELISSTKFVLSNSTKLDSPSQQISSTKFVSSISTKLDPPGELISSIKFVPSNSSKLNSTNQQISSTKFESSNSTKLDSSSEHISSTKFVPSNSTKLDPPGQQISSTKFESSNSTKLDSQSQEISSTKFMSSNSTKLDPPGEQISSTKFVPFNSTKLDSPSQQISSTKFMSSNSTKLDSPSQQISSTKFAPFNSTKLDPQSQELEAQKDLVPIPSGNFEYYFNSTEAASNELLEALKDDSCYVIGLYGKRGSGKTTLVRAEIHKYEQIFDRVLFPALSNNQSHLSIQEGIANMLDIHFERGDNVRERSKKINSGFDRVDGTTLVILDDFPLIHKPQQAGIPYGRKQCKVLLTTRHKEDCSWMECDRSILLKPLSGDEAWRLLQKLPGVNSRSDDLFDVAKKVAFQCNGLPGLIKDVASSLEKKPLQEWKEALVSLSHSTALYQICISFIEKDIIRDDFTKQLHHALHHKGFKTYKDDESLKRKVSIEKLVDHIEESRFAIVILSKSYADSERHLEELVKILECKDKEGKSQLVLPIFYEMPPIEVRHVRNYYANAVTKHAKNGKDSKTIKTWKKALHDVWKLNRFEKRHYWSRDQLIAKIVNFADDHRHRLHIQSMYMYTSPPQTSKSVAVEFTKNLQMESKKEASHDQQLEAPEDDKTCSISSNVKTIPIPTLHVESTISSAKSVSSNSTPKDDTFRGVEPSCSGEFMYLGSTTQAKNDLLKALDDDAYHTIGLFGKRGSGKTALVKAEIPEYETIFRLVVYVTMSEAADIANLQNQIAPRLNLNFQAVTRQYKRASAIETALLKNKDDKDKVLVIFDHVTTNLIPQYTEEIGIPKPSKQCKFLLITHKKNHCCMMRCQYWIPLRHLSHEDSWKLLRQNSSIDNDSLPDQRELAYEVAGRCKGLPHVIKDVASSLENKNIEDDRKLKEYWEETLDCLKHENARFQVFISFRGPDTRHDFVEPLHDALKEAGFKVFLDNQIRSGDHVSDTLIEVIEQSRASIVVLSQNYAQSTWCLEELLKIMECREKIQQLVYPIFHKVDPSHVRHLQGTYKEAMAKKEERFGKGKVLEWRSALHKVSGLSGKHYKSGSYKTFMQEVVDYLEDNKHRLHII